MIDCIFFCASVESFRFYYATELPELPKSPNIAEIEKQNPPQIKANDTDRDNSCSIFNFWQFRRFWQFTAIGKILAICFDQKNKGDVI
jgi:hypothetical protein